MEMKWHPIIDGDLSGIPRDKKLLFSYTDNNGSHVDFGYIESRLEKYEYVSIGDIKLPVEAKTVEAWMEIPLSFKPNDCNRCTHLRVWIDGSGSRWSMCELMDIATFVPLKKCPLKK